MIQNTFDINAPGKRWSTKQVDRGNGRHNKIKQSKSADVKKCKVIEIVEEIPNRDRAIRKNDSSHSNDFIDNAFAPMLYVAPTQANAVLEKIFR